MTSAVHMSSNHRRAVVKLGCKMHREFAVECDVEDWRHREELRDQNAAVRKTAGKFYKTGTARFRRSKAREEKFRHAQVQHAERAGSRCKDTHDYAASHSHYGREYQGDNHQSSIENHSNPREGLFVAPFQFETGYRQPTVQPSVAFPRPKQISAPDQQSSAINRISIFITLAAFRLRGVVSLTAQSSPAASKLGRANAVPLFQLARVSPPVSSRTVRAWPAGVEATPPAGIFPHYAEAYAA